MKSVLRLEGSIKFNTNGTFGMTDKQRLVEMVELLVNKIFFVICFKQCIVKKTKTTIGCGGFDEENTEYHILKMLSLTYSSVLTIHHCTPFTAKPDFIPGKVVISAIFICKTMAGFYDMC